MPAVALLARPTMAEKISVVNSSCDRSYIQMSMRPSTVSANGEATGTAVEIGHTGETLGDASWPGGNTLHRERQAGQTLATRNRWCVLCNMWLHGKMARVSAATMSKQPGQVVCPGMSVLLSVICYYY